MTHHRRTLWLCKSGIGLIVILALIGLQAAPAAAQETGGSISGAIKDAQAAFLPGVTVTLRNIDTNAVQTAVTNQQGVYVVTFVPIGRYTLTAELAGFSTAKQESIEVRVADRLRIDLTLQVGVLAETVTVTGQSMLLETSTASRGQVISKEQVADLPLLGRNPFMLAQLAPGVQYTPALASRSNRPFDNGGMDNLSIAGGVAFTNELLLDGVPNSGSERGTVGSLAFVPSPDATAEFKVQSNLYDAQYGRTGGGVINVILKSGTNAFHGAAYMYYRDESLNANTFDGNRAGVPKAALYWNQPGATISGPVRIPGLYDGRDKTFFMYSYERISSEIPYPQVFTVPSAAERAGDFSKTVTATGAPVIIYDPLTTRLVAGRYIRDPFQGNVIPANRMDPVALNLLKYVPLPNAAGQTNNLLVPGNNRADVYNNHAVKIDQTINQQHRFFVRFAWNQRHEINDYMGYAKEAAPTYIHSRTNVGLSGEVTSVLSNTFVLSSRVGYIRHGFTLEGYGDGYDPAQLGFPSSLVSQLPRKSFPVINYSGYSSFGPTTATSFTTTDTYSWSEIFSKSAGNHSLRFGGEYRHFYNNYENPVSSLGNFSFTAAYTQFDAQQAASNAGNGVASLLLGYPASGSSPINPHYYYRNNYAGVFLQDDWRLTPKLTLNAGIRWDYESPITEAGMQQNRGFDATSPNPFVVPGMQLKGGLLFVDDANPRPFVQDWNNIQPRVGATYALTEKTVLRGGYGLGYLPTFDTGRGNGFSLATTFVSSVDGGITPSGSLRNPYPNGLSQPVGSSQGLATLVGNGYTYDNNGRTIPYVHQFSVGVQRELPWQVVLDASYVGSRTRGYPVAKGINEITAEQLATGTAMLVQVKNPFEGLLPGTAINGATVPLQQLVRPYPQFTGITEAARPIGEIDYNSLQMTFNKRLSQGLQFLVSYTYSKRRQRTEFLNAQNSWDQPLEVVSGDDAPHRLFVSATYRLPNVNDNKGFLNLLLGGWQMNGIAVWQSGLPVGVAAGSVLVGDPHIDNPGFSRWFNTCTTTTTGTRQNCANDSETVVWQVQAPYTLRTSPTRLDTVRTDRPMQLDFSIFKAFNLPAGVKIQVRAEAFNAFNTPWFGAPNTTVTATAFGTVTPTQANDARNIQLGFRLSF
jgi:hypothetical protein